MQSRLPSTVVTLGYAAGGACLFCSYLQMRQMMTLQAGDMGAWLGNSLPAALLFGGAVLWRIAGHLWNREAITRGFKASLITIICSAGFIETVSITTSMMSVNLGVNTRLSDDASQSQQGRAVHAANDAASRAAQRLASNIENMPANYITRGNESAQQLTELLTAQRRLLQTRSDEFDLESPTHRTLSEVSSQFGMSADAFKWLWAWMIGIGLTVVPLATNFSFASASDGSMQERAPAKPIAAAPPPPKPKTTVTSMACSTDETATLTITPSTRTPGASRKKTFQQKVAEADKAIKAGEIQPEIKPVAAHCQCSTRTATSILAELVEQGGYKRDAAGRVRLG